MFKTATAIGCFCFEYSIQWQKFIKIEELWFFNFWKNLVSAFKFDLINILAAFLWDYFDKIRFLLVFGKLLLFRNL